MLRGRGGTIELSDWDAWTQGRGGGVKDMQQVACVTRDVSRAFVHVSLVVQVGLLERQASLKGSASQQFEAYKRSLGSQ